MSISKMGKREDQSFLYKIGKGGTNQLEFNGWEPTRADSSTTLLGLITCCNLYISHVSF